MGGYLSTGTPAQEAQSLFQEPYKREYGWARDTTDSRDWLHIFANPVNASEGMPDQVDLSQQCGPVLDQLKLGSCTANALSGAYYFDELRENTEHLFIPSRLFIYYNERKREHSVSEDSGASLRDGIKTIAKIGVCPETDWPYDIERFADPPLERCYEIAKYHRAIEYRRLAPLLDQMKQCLIAGYPFVFGFDVFESFEGDQVKHTGVMPLPQPDEELLGGHAVMAIGYDDKRKAILVRNSWGKDWGIKGNFWMPYEYIISKHASDFWTVRRVSDPDHKN